MILVARGCGPERMCVIIGRILSEVLCERLYFIINSNFPQGFLMKSLINSDFVSIIMLTYTGLDKTYDLAHYTKRAPAFGIIRSTKIHSYTERSARSYDNPKCKK